jgi:parallel beta-helix repeat protein
LNISNNTITGGSYGIYLQSTGNCLIENDTISDTDGAGIYLYNSVNNILLSNNLTRSSIGIYPTLADYTQQTIPTSNTVNGRPVYYYKSADESDVDVPLDAGQVIVGGATNLHIHNLNLSDQNYALLICWSSNILIENNTFEHNSPYSIYSYESDDNIYNNNTISESDYGLQLSLCDNNELLNNTITGGNYGVYLEDSNTISLENNTIFQTSEIGIRIYSSMSCNLQNNTLLQSSIDIIGDDDIFGSQIIPVTNTVNGRPVYYYANVNLDNESIPPVDAGEVILGNVVYANVSNQNLSDQNLGLLIGCSANITVFNNILNSNSPTGMRIDQTVDSQIEQNNITSCETGVSMIDSVRNSLIENVVMDCDDVYYFESSNECNITDNQMTTN